MYVLCKKTRVNGYSDSLYNPVVSSNSLEEISDNIKKRVRDGCPMKDLLVFEEVTFDMDCSVKFEVKNT